MNRTLAEQAAASFLWSAVKNWGGNAVTLLTFFILARLLDPREFGTASAALLVLMLINMFAEFGFGDAIIQRQNFKSEDANLPFFVSLMIAVLLSLVAICLSRSIERWFNINGLYSIIVGIAILAPLVTISLFQEANYKRVLDFKTLAIRVFAANLTGGAVAIICAYLGCGVWSLVAQNYVSVLVGAVWLWWRPYWRPSLTFRWASFLEMTRFGGAVVVLRSIEFFSMRYLDVLIAIKYGPVLLGFYTVGSRLFQTLMQLLQTVFNDVSLSILSKISSERERMAAIYRTSVVFAAYTTSPLFVLAASLSPEICNLLLGPKWAGVESITAPLFLLGAVQCVQFLNAPFLSARGRPGRAALVSGTKSLSVVLALSFISVTNVYALVILFAVAQLIGTPLSFYFAMREVGAPAVAILRDVFPSVFASGIAFLTILWVRTVLPHLNVFESLFVHGSLFVVMYGGIVAVVGRSHINDIVLFVKNRKLAISDS